MLHLPVTEKEAISDPINKEIGFRKRQRMVAARSQLIMLD